MTRLHTTLVLPRDTRFLSGKNVFIRPILLVLFLTLLLLPAAADEVINPGTPIDFPWTDAHAQVPAGWNTKESVHYAMIFSSGDEFHELLSMWNQKLAWNLSAEEIDARYQRLNHTGLTRYQTPDKVAFQIADIHAFCLDLGKELGLSREQTERFADEAVVYYRPTMQGSMQEQILREGLTAREEEKEISARTMTAAEDRIHDLDTIIGWFKGNRSTSDLPELSPIISKRELGIVYLSNARDDFSSGDYPRAKEKAQEAYTKINESYNQASELQNEIQKYLTPQPPACNPFPAFSFRIAHTQNAVIICLVPGLLLLLLIGIMRSGYSPFSAFLARYTAGRSVTAIALGMWILLSALLLAADSTLDMCPPGFGFILFVIWAGLVLAILLLDIITGILLIRRAWDHTRKIPDYPSQEWIRGSTVFRGRAGLILLLTLMAALGILMFVTLALGYHLLLRVIL